MTAISSLQHAIENAAAARSASRRNWRRLDAERSDVDVEDARLQAEFEAGRRQVLDAQARARARPRDGRGPAGRAGRGARGARAAPPGDARRASRNWPASRRACSRSRNSRRPARSTATPPASCSPTATARLRQFGSLADYLEVERGYERAVEACLGDLLQHVLVPEPRRGGSRARARARAQRRPLRLPRRRRRRAGRRPRRRRRRPRGSCRWPRSCASPATTPRFVRQAIGHAWIAAVVRGRPSSASLATDLPVVTPDGDVLRGAHLVYGGVREESRGILSTKREVKELRDRAVDDPRGARPAWPSRRPLERGAPSIGCRSEIAGLVAEAHAQEKAIVGLEALVARAVENRERLARKVRRARAPRARGPQEERRALEARETEARASVVAPGGRAARGRRAARDRAAPARRTPARPPRSSAAARPTRGPRTPAWSSGPRRSLTEVARQQDVIDELESRFAARQEEARQNEQRQVELRQAIEDGKRQLDLDLQDLDALRGEVRAADERLSALRHARRRGGGGDPRVPAGARRGARRGRPSSTSPA